MVNTKRLILLLSLSFWLVSEGFVGAAPAPVTQPMAGITLSPFIQQLSIAPDDAFKKFNLDVTNHTAAIQELQLSARDFGSLNETGGVLLEGSKSYNQKYGLTAWLSLGSKSLVLQPQETQTVEVTINNQTTLRPGGHYGAIVASVTNTGTASGNQVALNQQLLSLILLNKVGGEHYDLRLDRVRQNGNWVHLPNEVRLRFRNPGNVHVVPRGLVKLMSPGGTVIAQGIINSESAYVLPESNRELIVPLKTVASALPLPGIYHIETEYRYDGIDRVAYKQFNVHFISFGLYVLAIAIAAGGGYVYIYRKRLFKNRSSAK